MVNIIISRGLHPGLEGPYVGKLHVRFDDGAGKRHGSLSGSTLPVDLCVLCVSRSIGTGLWLIFLLHPFILEAEGRLQVFDEGVFYIVEPACTYSSNKKSTMFFLTMPLRFCGQISSIDKTIFGKLSLIRSRFPNSRSTVFSSPNR